MKYKPPFYLIANIGTLQSSPYAQAYKKHLVLAHLVPQHPLYRRIILNMINRGHDVILDNGAYESSIVTNTVLEEIIIDLEPPCVVLPDLVDQNAWDSFNASITFYRHFQDTYPELWARTRWMLVPQGTSKDNVIDVYRGILSNPTLYQGITLGVGLAYKMWNGSDDEHGRKQMWDEINALPGAQDAEFHILGARWNPTRYYSCPNVVGLDTMKPCRCALNNYTYPVRKDVKATHDSPQEADDSLLEVNVKIFCHCYGLEECI